MGTQITPLQKHGRKYTYADLHDVEVTGINPATLDGSALEVLRCEAEYTQAMVDADADDMRRLTSPNLVYVHMSGMHQTREEYLFDVTSGALRYFHIGIKDPVINVDGDTASIDFTSVLKANAYGARGTFPMHATHWFHRSPDSWIIVNPPTR